ncbi:MAG: GDSL-type esterase/lipase family protein [Polyangia bacterium]
MPPIVNAALAGLLAVTAGAGSAAAQARIPTHVACVGDSITAGSGASSTSKNYPADLQGLFGSSVKVSNFGHSGATMLSTGDTPYVKQSEYTSATSFVSGAGANAVVDVIIMLGTNDSKPVNWNASGGGTQATQFKADCGKLVDHFASLATHPLVYLALPPAAFTNSYTIDGAVIKNQIIPVLKQVAMEKGLPTIDVQTPTASVPKDFGDGVHPNDTGYVLVAQVMHDGLLSVQSSAGGGGGAGAGGGGGAGAAGAGGRAAGGTFGTGGGSSTGGNSGSGGTSSTGGSPGAGGSAEGGVSGGTGGTGTGGVATGGVTGTGGLSATGGQLGSTGGSAATGTGGTPESDGSSGCSCSVPRRRATVPTTVLAVFALALAFSRKRRR